MLLIRHRINTLEDLKSVDPSMGIELDIRYEGSRLILHHDPFTTGLDFEELLKNYHHAFMILNIKSEGIEEAVVALLRQYKVNNYFFLDVSFPALIKLWRGGEKNIAVRFSEYEPLEQCLALKDKIKWVWVDCFNECPLDKEAFEHLREYFKICLVSPELQGHSTDRITEFREQLKEIEINAVCTKRPDLWT